MSEQAKVQPDKITIDPDVLRTPSEPTTQAEIDGMDLVERLKVAMKTAWVGGHGLAAIQIGVPVRCAVYQTPGGVWVTLLNPLIMEYSDLRMKRREGCLSIPGMWFGTHRYEKIKIENGPAEARYTIEAEGVEAWIIQHEIDHMNGVLCFQRTKVPGRNDACFCSSGKKFKKCHGA